MVNAVAEWIGTLFKFGGVVAIGFIFYITHDISERTYLPYPKLRSLIYDVIATIAITICVCCVLNSLGFKFVSVIIFHSFILAVRIPIYIFIQRNVED